MADDSVVLLLQNGIEQDPENRSLRFHLARTASEMGKLEMAQAQVDWLLSREPDDLDALKLAIQVYSGLGLNEKANRFRRIQAALSTESEPEPPSHAPVTEIPEAPEPANETSEDNLIPMRVIEGGYGEPIWNEEKATVKLEDVAGLEAVKRRLELSLLGPLRNPELMKLYGKNLQGGLLLYGPPGCGKTFMARAVAGELGARFIAIGLNDVLDMYVGQSERNLHELFESARRQKPTVLFFDEIDALGRKRSLNRHAATRDVVNQLLAELDSMSGNNQGIYVLAATNHPWDVDTALRRPGRLDRMVLVLPPDKPARLKLIERHLASRPHEKIDFQWLADKTEGFSGADLAHLADSAAELAMEASLKADAAVPIQMNFCKQALKEIKPSTRAWLDTARNFALFANEGGQYDDLVQYLRQQRML